MPKPTKAPEERAALAAARAEKLAARQAAAREKSEVALVQLDRKCRVTEPEGEFDRQGRWYPSERESSSHLNGCRAPSVAWPYSLLKATSSRDHLKALRKEKPSYWRALLEASLKRASDEQIAEYLRTHPEIFADPRLAALAIGEGPRAAALAALDPQALPPLSAPAAAPAMSLVGV